jgi:hypothetical protein
MKKINNTSKKIKSIINDLDNANVAFGQFDFICMGFCSSDNDEETEDKYSKTLMLLAKSIKKLKNISRKKK